MNKIFCLVLCAYITSAANYQQWKSRKLYSLLTDRFAPTTETNLSCTPLYGQYCGGTFKGIERSLDYIQTSLGFDAILLSPIVKQIEEYTPFGTSYHGYWAENIFAINPHFGTKEDLLSLVTSAHRKGIFVMIDVAVNQMGGSSSSAVNWNRYTPFNSSSHYHPYVVLNEATQTQTQQEQAWFGTEPVTLPDLNTENPYVQATLYQWISDLVRTYGFDGVRADAARYIRQPFWSGFCAAAGVYCVGDVNTGSISYAAPYQNFLDSMFNYPLFHQIRTAFSTTGALTPLKEQYLYYASKWLRPHGMFTIMETHDDPRFPSLGASASRADVKLLQNAVTMLYMAQGIPMVYYGQESGYNGASVPLNREARWNTSFATTPYGAFFKLMNQMRTVIFRNDPNFDLAPIVTSWSDDYCWAFQRNQTITVLSGQGNNDYVYTLPATVTKPLSSGTLMRDVISCGSRKIATTGFTIDVVRGLPQLWYPDALLKNSGICGQ